VIGVLPDEAWSERNFKIFGSVAYKVVPRVNMIEYEATCRKFLFVAYFEQAKAYRILIPCANHVVSMI
jgi:hypothetical protein